MPDEDVQTDATSTDAPYTFPFTVAPDLATVADDDLRALHIQVREHAQTFAGLSPADTTDATIAALRACRDLAIGIRDELTARDARATDAAALADEIAAADIADLTAEPEESGDDADEPEGNAGTDSAVTAAAGTDLAARLGTALVRLLDQDGNGGLTAARRGRSAPSVRNLRRNGEPQLPDDAQRPVYASMVAAAGAAGFTAGQTLDKFADAAKLLSKQIDLHPSLTAGRAKGNPSDPKRPVTVYGGPDAPGRRFVMKNYSRTPGIELRRDFPEDLRLLDGGAEGRGYAIAEHARSERRLPGGSLIKSAELAVKAGRSLTAAAGWCAPSETIYELCELETLDGILDVPEMQTSRGGWQIPEDGGPDFGTIYGAIGNSGDTHLTEAEVIADTSKVCTDIPCPDFDDVRLGVDYVCLTGGLLQRRGYPEVVARWGRGAVTALAHKINQGFIATIVAASGAATVIPSDPSGDDAAAAVMSAVELAIMDAKYRNRQGFSETLEVVLPMWVVVPIRAALARANGVRRMDVTDAEILSWFTVRKAVPRFVYDWQDSASGLVGGPGASTPLAALPSTVQFLVYPAGTWVKPVQDVVSLDTVYDSTKLATNEYTGVFVEDGWAALQMCPISRLYTAYADPSGVTGCCPGAEVS
jgi:hypothetical protein